MRQRNGRILAGATALAACLAAGPARAETTICTVISSLPYTINAQGSYCLDRNLSYSANVPGGAAITISVDFVVLDLNGFKVGGGGAGPSTQTTGVLTTNHKNVTVKNGNIRGFYRGVYLRETVASTSQGHLVEDIRADQNTFEGIHVEGRGNVVRNNQVVDTTGTTFDPNSNTAGLNVVGPGSRILNNDVTETVAMGTGTAYGILAVDADGAVIENNRVGNSVVVTTSVGIQINSSGDVMVAFSRLARLDSGIVFDGASTGKYTENVTSGVTHPYSGGTDIVGTNF
jgi:hypothetical protein